MDPITIGMLMTSVAGLLGQRSASSQATNTAANNLALQKQGLDIQQQGLDFTKQNAGQQLGFAKAGRTDAFGNTTGFDDALNQWITSLTPQQQQLINASQNEQMKGLTTDAALSRASREQVARQNTGVARQNNQILGQNRDVFGLNQDVLGQDRGLLDQNKAITGENKDILAQNKTVRDRAAARATGATEDFNTARAGYRFDQPKSEAAIMDELTRLITQAQGTGDRALTTLVDRQALRQKGNMPVINSGPLINSTGGQQLAKTLLQARQQALTESQSRQSAHDARYLPEMSTFANMQDAGRATPSTLGDMKSLTNLLQPTATTNLTALPGVTSSNAGASVANNTASTQQDMASGVAKALQDAAGNVTASDSNITKAFGDINTGTADATKTLLAGAPRTADITSVINQLNKLKGNGITDTVPGYYGGSPATNWKLNPDLIPSTGTF